MRDLGMIDGQPFNIGDHFIFHFRPDGISGQLDENLCINGISLANLVNKHGSKNIEIIPDDSLKKMCGQSASVEEITQAEINAGNLSSPTEQEIIQKFIDFVCTEENNDIRLILDHSLIHYINCEGTL